MIRKLLIIGILASMMIIWYAVNQPAFAAEGQMERWETRQMQHRQSKRCERLRTWIANSYMTSFDTRYPNSTDTSAIRAAALQDLYFELKCDAAKLADKITKEK